MEAKQIIVNGKPISEEEFKKLQESGSVKLKLMEDGSYRTLLYS